MLTQKKPFAGEWTRGGSCSHLSWLREGCALCKAGLPVAEGAALGHGAGGLSRRWGGEAVLSSPASQQGAPEPTSFAGFHICQEGGLAIEFTCRERHRSDAVQSVDLVGYQLIPLCCVT